MIGPDSIHNYNDIRQLVEIIMYIIYIIIHLFALLFKKSLRGKTLIKNFSNTKVVLVTTIPALEAQAGMIVYTFLLPCKNERCRECVSLFEAKWSATQRSVKIGELFPGKRVGVFNL